MVRYPKIGTFIVLIFLLAGFVDLTFSAKIFVDAQSAGGDGSSWANAYPKLQKAIKNANAGDKIWVAAGTYKPTVDYGIGSVDPSPNNPHNHFRMKNGVAIYGGFAGTETALAQRKVNKNKTILSGDIGVKGDSSDNCFHVFFHPAVTALDATAILDGFTITAGNANDVEWPHDTGGGMYNEESSPTVTNCTFKSNTASEYGGGMANDIDAHSTVTNCTFRGNTAEYGGGMDNYQSDSTMTNCIFIGNTAGENGGGMDNYESSPIVTDCTFRDNTASNYGGGGIYNYTGTPIVTNCTFSGNTADTGGGLMNEYLCDPIVTNCVFSGNTAAGWGGGMENYDQCGPTVMNCTFSGNTAEYGGGLDNYESNPAVSNSIFWNNTASSDGNEFNNDPGIPTIAYSNIAGSLGSGSWDTSLGTDMGGNMDTDPLFADAAGPDLTLGTADDDLQLLSGAPCIDAADGDVALATDLLGNPRHDDPGISNIGVGTPDYVDMGAYEFYFMTVTSPPESARWARGESYKIRWLTSNSSPNVKIFLFKASSKVATLTSSTANDGVWKWVVPADLVLGTDYQIKVVCRADTSVFGFSDVFEILRPGDLYTPIEVSIPDSNSVWDMGSGFSINWAGGEPGTEVKIQLRKGKKLIKTIKAATANDGQATWTVPYDVPAGINYRVKVISSDYSYVYDASDKFQIRIPPINVTVPPAGKQWARGKTYPIKWTGGKPSQNVKIELRKAGALKKTLTASTANDGVFKWKVPLKFALGDDYSVRVIYLPDNSIQDDSEIFEIGTIGDHVFEIEMSLSYDYGEGDSIAVAGEPVDYQFDAWMRVDSTVVSGTVKPPGDTLPIEAAMQVEDDGNWLGIYAESTSLEDLSDFTDGEYIFTVTYANGKSESTPILFALEDGNPIPPVDQPLLAKRPLHNAPDVPLTTRFKWIPLDNPDWTYGIEWFPVDENSQALNGEFEKLPYDTFRTDPVDLSPDTLYEAELTVNHAIWSTNDDGIPYVVDKDSEVEIHFTTVSSP